MNGRNTGNCIGGAPEPRTEIPVPCPAKGIYIEVETKGLDEAVAKANQLVELLKEAQQITDSLFGKQL